MSVRPSVRHFDGLRPHRSTDRYNRMGVVGKPQYSSFMKDKKDMLCKVTFIYYLAPKKNLVLFNCFVDLGEFRYEDPSNLTLLPFGS